MNSDQSLAATFALPDLRGELSDISVKVSKSTYEISGKLTVYSDEAKATGVKANLYLSYEETLDDDALLLGSITLGSVNPGSSVSKTFKCKVPTNSSGRYVIALIDPGNAIREVKETNNTVVSYYKGEAPQLEVTVDEASRVSGVIEHGEGSTLETVSGGSNLSLTLLPHSFMSSPEISLTGVSEMKGLPQTITITMLAGAQLGSEGLHLLKPASLTMGLPSDASAKTLIGLLSRDNGRRFQFYPIEVNGSTATFQMMHFTSVGVGEITCSDISTLGNPSWLSGQALAEHRIAIAGVKYELNCDHLEDVTLWDAYVDEIAGILEDWYFGKSGVLDQLMYVPENPEDYIPIVTQFVRWVKFTDAIGIQERWLTKEQPCGLWSGENCRTFDDLERGGKDAIVNTIRNGIIAANKACLDGDSTKDAIALKWLLLADICQEEGLNLFTAADAAELWELKTCGVYSLEVSPSQATIGVGDTPLPLQAIVKDKAGKVLSGHPVFWFSDDKSIAAVDKNSGLVTGVSGGTASVFAFLRENYFLKAYSDITVNSFNLNIESMSVDEANSELHIMGSFGSKSGNVTVGGQQVNVKQWGPSEIICDLPTNLAGDVYVEIQGRKSNVVPLTEWRGQLRYTSNSNIASNYTITCDFHFRADIHGFREVPHEKPSVGVIRTHAARDSKCRWEVSGTPYSPTCTFEYSGSGEWIYEGTYSSNYSNYTGSFLLYWAIHPTEKTIDFTWRIYVDDAITRTTTCSGKTTTSQFPLYNGDSYYNDVPYIFKDNKCSFCGYGVRDGVCLYCFVLNLDDNFAGQPGAMEKTYSYPPYLTIDISLEWDRIEPNHVPDPHNTPASLK